MTGSLLTGSSFIGVDFWDGNWDELHSRYWVRGKHHQINQPKKFKFDSSKGNSMTSESYCNMTFVIVDSWIFPQRSSVGSWILFPSQCKMVFWATEREHVPMSSQMVFEFRGWALSPARWHEPILKFRCITCRCCQISNISVWGLPFDPFTTPRICGRNGCGKSTLMTLICSEMNPTENKAFGSLAVWVVGWSCYL